MMIQPLPLLHPLEDNEPWPYPVGQLPVWTPSHNHADNGNHGQEPPFCLPLKNKSSGHGITAEEYAQLTMLPLAAENTETRGVTAKPLLPTDLPIVQKAIQAAAMAVASNHNDATVTTTSEDGAATSRALDGGLAQQQPPPPRRRSNLEQRKEEEGEEGDDDLETMLEETLAQQEEEEEEEEEEQQQQEQQPPPPLHHPSSRLLPPDFESSKYSAAAIEHALLATNFSSWDAFATHVKNKAAAKAKRNEAEGKAPTTTQPPRKKRKKPVESKEVTLSTIFHRNNPFYHQAFVKAYATAKKTIDQQGRDRRKTELLQSHTHVVRRWSSLKPADHTWFLRRQGLPLVGSEAQRYAQLWGRVEQERKEYYEAMQEEAEEHRERYQTLTARQASQLATDLKIRRQRCMNASFLGTANAAATAAIAQKYTHRMDISFLNRTSTRSTKVMDSTAELERRGVPPVLAVNGNDGPRETAIPGNKFYLPATLPAGVGKVLEGSSRQTGTGSSGGLYRKVAVPEIWDDDVVKELMHGNPNPVVVGAAAGALQCMLQSALLKHHLAWEVPVVVVDDDDATTTTVTGSGRKKCVFLGKPLLPTKETLRDKHRRLQKYAALSLLVQDAQDQKSGDSGREAVYWSSSSDCIVRTHARMCTSGSSDGIKRTVFVATPEYLPPPDVEEATPFDLSLWWSKLRLAPGAETVTVAHVHVPLNKLMHCRQLTVRDIEAAWEGYERENTGGGGGSGGGGGMGVEGEKMVDTGAAMRAVGIIIDEVKKLEPGTYILKHECRAPGVKVLEAAFDGEYDVHAAQAVAGELDPLADLYVPRLWRPYREDIAQIPYTFPVGFNVVGGGGGGEGEGLKDEEKREKEPTKKAKKQHAKREARNSVPATATAVAAAAVKGGEGRGGRRRRGANDWQGDKDMVAHVATIDRAEYEAGLYEEL